MNKLNVPSYSSLLFTNHRIRSIQELYEGINTLIDEPPSEPFDPSWRTDGTLAELCSDIVSDPNAVVGDVFLGQVTCSGLPEGMSNGELEVLVTQGQNDKLLVLTLTSTNVAPYHWEQSYYDGTLYGWKASDPAGAAAAVEVALIGTDQDPATATTIYGAKAYAVNLTNEEALRTNNLAAIMSLAADPNAGTTTVTTNPEWKLVYTDADDRILLGKRQDDTWYFAADLDDILDAVIDGYGT